MGPLSGDINLVTVPMFGFVGFCPSSQLYPVRLYTHTLFTPSLLRQERSIRPRPSRLRQKNSSPVPYLTHSTSHYHPSQPPTTASPPPLPITMSIRRNVRVSFLLNDSESSFELCVFETPSCPMRKANRFYADQATIALTISIPRADEVHREAYHPRVEDVHS